MKVIIAGGRDFDDYALVEKWCDTYLKNSIDIEIVSGRCSIGTLTFTADDGTKVYGADGLGERYAKEKGYPVILYPAHTRMYGKKAFYVRNRLMGENANALISFWDGKSRGTKMMIEIMHNLTKPYKIVRY